MILKLSEIKKLQYLRDAHTAFRDAMKKTKRFNWPLRVNQESTGDHETEFFEGTFVAMLLNKVNFISLGDTIFAHFRT